MNITLDLPDELGAALRAHLAATGGDLNRFAVAALRDALSRGPETGGKYERERSAAREAARRPGRLLDVEDVLRRHGIPVGRTPEEVAASADAALAALPEADRAEMERRGLL